MTGILMEAALERAATVVEKVYRNDELAALIRAALEVK